MISSIRRFSAIVSRAWISMSVACPSKPPQSWWMRIFAFGSAIRFPFAPAASRSAPQRHRDPDPDRLDVGLDGLDRVVDREAGVDGAAGTVDVAGDVPGRILRLKVEQ